MAVEAQRLGLVSEVMAEEDLEAQSGCAGEVADGE